jgi:hypothetical protein
MSVITLRRALEGHTTLHIARTHFIRLRATGEPALPMDASTDVTQFYNIFLFFRIWYEVFDSYKRWLKCLQSRSRLNTEEARRMSGSKFIIISISNKI